MHKRIISLVLILALLPMCLAVPVLADETDESLWINALDYTTVNNSGSNFFTVTNSRTISLALPSSAIVRNVDFLVFSQMDFTSVTVYNGYSGDPVSMNVIKVDSNTYRFYGYISNDFSTLYITFETGSDKTNYCQLFNFNYSLIRFDSFSTPVSGTGTALAQTNKNLFLSYPSGNTVTSWTYSSYDDFDFYDTNGIFSMQYSFTDWKKYDVLDIQLTFICESIGSVAGYFGNDVIDIDVTSFANDNSNGQYIVFVSLDISNLDRMSTNTPTIIVTGNADFEMTNSAAIRYASGHIVVDEVSPNLYWFTKLQSWLSSGFSSVTSGLTTLGSNISTWISDQTTAITGWFTTVNSNITTFRTNVSTWFTTQTNALTSSIGSWGQSLKDSIDALPDKIAEALKDLVVPADGAVESMATKSEELVSNRFGGVFEGAQIVDNWASQLQSQAATQILTVPVVQMNILGKIFPLGGWEVDLVPDGFEIIFESVKIIIDILATAAFINGVKSRLERTLEK